jgi:predicted dienelactone hydrolase
MGMSMRLFRFGLVAALCLTATLTHAAGLRLIKVRSDGAPTLQIAVWSPCSAAAGEVKLRTTVLPGTMDCPVSGEKLPIIVTSHGFGGSFTGSHDTAEILADAGFVVVGINHPADTGAGDMARADTLAALIERPADIKRVIDYMLGEWSDRAKLDPDKIGFFGFSRGRLYRPRHRRSQSGHSQGHGLLPGGKSQAKLRGAAEERDSGTAAGP